MKQGIGVLQPRNLKCGARAIYATMLNAQTIEEQ